MYLRLLLLMFRTRRGPRLSLWETSSTPFRVRVTDLDLQRHMNNGTYLTILDLGRMDLMLRSGFWARMKELGWYPVVAAQTITYRRSLTLGQKFLVDTHIIGGDGHSVFLEQTFRVDETVYARAVIRTRFLRKAGGSVSYSELEEAAGGLPPHLDVPEWILSWAEASKLPSNKV